MSDVGCDDGEDDEGALRIRECEQRRSGTCSSALQLVGGLSERFRRADGSLSSSHCIIIVHIW